MLNVGDKFTFQDVRYIVPPARPSLNYPHEAEGAKATVVRVQRLDDKSMWALKVFKHRYRTPDQLTAATRLATVSQVFGLSAGRQLVVQPSDLLAQESPLLEWAVLMPWVEGFTWGEILSQVQQKRRTYSPSDAILLAFRLVAVLERLEREGMVHCDLSAGNVLIPTNGRFGAELVDLEDMVIRGEHGASYTPGTHGYALPDVRSTACAEGDRYAAAILLAEALALAIPAAAEYISSEGVFGGNREDKKAQLVFDSIHYDLLSWQPAFAALFKQAWNAPSLRSCAPIAALLNSISFETAPVVWAAGAALAEDVTLRETLTQLQGHAARYFRKTFGFVTVIANKIQPQPHPQARRTGNPPPASTRHERGIEDRSE